MDVKTKKSTVISKPNQIIGFIHFNAKDNIVIFLYKSFDCIGCELLFLDRNIDNFPQKIICRKLIFLESEADFIEMNTQNNHFFVKLSNSFKIYDLNGEFLSISFNPLNFYQMKHSSDFILLFQKALITKYPTLPFKVYNYRGELLNRFDLILKKSKGIELLDIFENLLFLKQFHDELLIINLYNGEMAETKGFVTPNWIEYYKNIRKVNMIICFYAFGIQIWSVFGKKIKEFLFSVLDERLFFIERFNGILITIKNENLVVLINLNEFKNQKEIFIEKKGQIFCTENGNLYIVNKKEVYKINLI